MRRAAVETLWWLRVVESALADATFADATLDATFADATVVESALADAAAA